MSDEPSEADGAAPWGDATAAFPDHPSMHGARGAQSLNPVRTIIEFSSAAALIVYFFAWSAVDAFYINLGIHMEEAGVGQSVLISRTATYIVTTPTVIFLFLSLSAILLVIGLSPGLVRRLLPYGSQRRRAMPPLILLIMLVIGFFLYSYLTEVGYNCARSVTVKGASATRHEGRHCEDLYAIGIRMSDTNAVWLSTKPPEGFHSGDKLVFLGQGDGQTVLYDIDRQLLFRVADGAVELTHHYPAG